MCNGQSFSFQACGHTQSVYTSFCNRSSQSQSKADTSCDRLDYGGAKLGVCVACKTLDARIDALREEIRSKQKELDEAILQRGSVRNSDTEMAPKVEPQSPRTRTLSKRISIPSSLRLTNKRKTSLPSTSPTTNNAAGSKSATEKEQKTVKFEGVVPTKIKKLSEDILDITNKWWKEREGYQITISAFQTKSLGMTSYKDKIGKCNAARDVLIKARFDVAEAELVKGFE